MSPFPSFPVAQSPSTKLPRKKPLPSISSVSSMSYISNPWFEELTNFLVEQAVSLLVCKYKFEDSLHKQLGFISFPVTEVLMDILLGFKKVKGNHIRLSSDINWTCLLRKMEEAELARQAVKHTTRSAASQHSTSRVGTSHRSTESPSVHPELTGDTNQDQSTESPFSLRPEMPIHQVLSPQDPGIGQEQMPRSPSEPKLSVISNAGVGSRSSKEIVNAEEEEDSEEEEDNRGSEKDEIKDFSESEQTSTSLPEYELEDFTNEPIERSSSYSP